MKIRFQKFAVCLVAILLLGSTVKLNAFALLGSVQPWMQASNGVILPGDIGGPMCLSNGYRWNVPVVTYGFDQSFLNYFGTNGVNAVENAIQILNDLPPASQMALTNYPFDSQHLNYTAASLSLSDLKSGTLALLLEQMGMASPTRHIFVLKKWNPTFLTSPFEDEWPDGTIPNDIVERNFDPVTLNPSVYVNDVLYDGEVYPVGPSGSYYVLDIVADLSADTSGPVADANDFNTLGAYRPILTYDDAGGLAYLLSTNNVAYETLLPGIGGVGINSHSFVDGAWRPGLDKITFIPQPVDPQSGAFLPTTNLFTDHYFTNGVLEQQQLARIIYRPDFLFSAGDIPSGIPIVPFFTRTGTTNWINEAAGNGNTNDEGPGVIQPPIQIMFNKLGRELASTGSISDEQVSDQSIFWGSFDGSTNAPISYPIPQTGTIQATVRMWLITGQFQESFVWKTNSLAGARYAMQTSIDLIHWTTLFTATNNGSVCTYLNQNPASSRRFYRLVPQ